MEPGALSGTNLASLLEPIMKHRLTFILSAFATVAFAGDTLTFTGIKLTTYIGAESNVTVYDVHQPGGNGWYKVLDESWADTILVNDLVRRKNESGNVSDTRWGSGQARLNLLTTRTPSSEFRVSFIRQRSATAFATVDMDGATATATGRAEDMDDSLETKPPAHQVGHGTDDRTKVAPQDKVFRRFTGTWSEVQGGGKSIDVWVPMGTIRGKSEAFVPGGSGSNAMATVSTSGGRYRLKPSTLTFGTPNPGRWLTGTFNANGSDSGIAIEVRSMNNVLLDIASSFSDVGNDFGFDLGQMMIMFTSTSPVTYKVMFKKRGALNKQMLLTVDPTIGLSGVNVELKFGDVDGDNEITAAEVDLILPHIGAHYPQAAFMAQIPGTSLSVQDLDIDGDGAITLNDYLISHPNIGLVGD